MIDTDMVKTPGKVSPVRPFCGIAKGGKVERTYKEEGREDPKDRKNLEELLNNIFKNKRIVERGFYEIMKDILE